MAAMTRPPYARADRLELAFRERVSLFLVSWVAMGIFLGFVSIAGISFLYVELNVLMYHDFEMYGMKSR